MRQWDARPRRSAPVLGRSHVKMPKGLGKLHYRGTLRACCARGRAHSGAAHPAVLAVMGGATAPPLRNGGGSGNELEGAEDVPEVRPMSTSQKSGSDPDSLTTRSLIQSGTFKRQRGLVQPDFSTEANEANEGGKKLR
jgi:hypothetical protein